ncbi:MAG TPA: cell wall-binding repeat-containing protein [Dermatophilaceae bacterium]|nr:cell wall-binding repeat-containing protein [Dermatophilaceae bacterium]
MRTRIIAATAVATVCLGAAASASHAETTTPSSSDLLTKARSYARDTSKSLLTQSPAAESSTSTAATLSRIAGSDRYQTAVKVSQAALPDKAAEGAMVFVASGLNFPDALAGGPAAAHMASPVLLVPSTGTLPSAVAAELDRLHPAGIGVIGGSGAVSDAMVTQLQSHATQEVFRVAGANRFETAAALSDFTVDFDAAQQPIFPKTVYIANGIGFADALSGGANAAREGAPLLLTTATSLPSPTAGVLDLMQPTTVVIMGGTGVVSSSVQSAVAAILPSAKIVRIAGADRFDTSAKASLYAFPTPAGVVTGTWLANGNNYPDALAAAPVVGLFGDVSLLLTKTACVPAPIVTEDNRLAPAERTAVGGTAAVSDAALALTPC